MTHYQQPGMCRYRGLVLRNRGNEVLTGSVSAKLTLPTISVVSGGRPTEPLRSGLRRHWGVDTVCIKPIVLGEGLTYEVMESLEVSDHTRRKSAWVETSGLHESEFQDANDYYALQRGLKECTPPGCSAPAEPFAMVGWFTELKKAIASAIAKRGLQLTGTFRQLNASPSFSLVRFETSGPSVWFKAVGPPNLQEFFNTLAIWQSCPGYLPEIWKAFSKWHGWLALETAGRTLDEVDGDGAWEQAVRDWARLQRESIAHLDLLLGCGMQDLRTSMLRLHAAPFFADMLPLMAEQAKSPPPVLSKGDLMLTEKEVSRALDHQESLAVPDSLGNLDLNPGNVLLDAEPVKFIDWSAAYVGNPFFSFEYLRQHYSHTAGAGVEADKSLVRAYFAEWSADLSGECLKQAGESLPLLAVFAYAIGCNAWSMRGPSEDPCLRRYLRTLVRRMHREAIQLQRNRSVPASDRRVRPSAPR